MKLVSTQVAYFFSDPSVKRNIRALLKIVALVIAVVIFYSVIFHIIMWNVEGQKHSWITGFYWTLTVMSTLGFGDITFQSDIGRLFSMLVLISGVVLLLIVLPFAFIRYFYAPWLETQIKMKAPRTIPEKISGHVLICNYDALAEKLIQRLKINNIPYYVIEPDPTEAASLFEKGVSVVSGDIDSKDSYEAFQTKNARMVIANREDTVNTNIVLTIRDFAPNVPIVATAGYEDSIDILELSGSKHVLPLKKWLGEQLANRVSGAHAKTHLLGKYRDLQIVELPVHGTTLLSGKTIRETKLREKLGISIVGILQKGKLIPARPDSFLTENSVVILVGTEKQVSALDELLVIYDVNANPLLVIGGGKVGRSAASALKSSGISVNIVERDESLKEKIGDIPDKLIIGNAADANILKKAGLSEAPSVLLTTNNDAMNIYLTSYCRSLNPEIRIVSRITYERNIDAIHRAGADFALSTYSLGVSAIISILNGKEMIVLEEGIDLFYLSLPKSLEGKTLLDSGIGKEIGLNVIAIQLDGKVTTNPPPSTVLSPKSELVMIGTTDQRVDFAKHFGTIEG